MIDMTVIAPTVCHILGIRPPKSSDNQALNKVIETLKPTERLSVIVIDALGMATWRRAKDYTPTLNKLEENHGTVIHSVMKSITPVNFATMLTGASPEIHGITDRTMALRHETIFDVLRDEGMSSATAARGQSSLGILISPHANHPGLAESNLDKDVTMIANSMLVEGYNLIWVQLLDVDDAGHRYGPYSPKSLEAVIRADKNLKTILKTANQHGYSVMVLADHGQHPAIGGLNKGTHGTDIPEDLKVPLLWANNSQLNQILN
jgi:predicted AlkP superfamily pyrophosphatase or phosphodiesterase